MRFHCSSLLGMYRVSGLSMSPRPLVASYSPIMFPSNGSTSAMYCVCLNLMVSISAPTRHLVGWPSIFFSLAIGAIVRVPCGIWFVSRCMYSSSLRTIAIASFIGIIFDSVASLFVSSQSITIMIPMIMIPSYFWNIFSMNIKYNAAPMSRTMVIICLLEKLRCILFVVLVFSFLYSS